MRAAIARRFRSTLCLALCSVCLVAIGCMDSAADAALDHPCGTEVGLTAAPLFGATPFAELLELSAREANSVVAVVTDGSLAALCTGVLLTPSLVLTAAHCVDEAQPAEVRVGRDAAEPQFRSGALRVEPHASRDLALLPLSRPVPSALALPLEPLRSPLERTGEHVQLAGFGLTEHGTIGVRLFTDEEVIAEDGYQVTVDGRGERGACLGDSGGPLLVRDAGGRLRVVGVLSNGSASCVDIDHFVLLYPVMSWIDEAIQDACQI